MRIFLLFCLAFALTAFGAEPVKFSTLRSGSTTYSNVTVLSASATDLYIQHAQGFANLKLRYLEPAVQQRFGYNPKAAEAAERQVEQVDAQFQAQLAAPAPQKPTPSRSSENSVADPVTPTSLLNRPAPALKGLKWTGSAPTFSTNGVTLVYFWEPWSIPAKRWMAPLQGLRDRLPGAVMLTVSRGTEAEQKAAEVRTDAPLAVDPQGVVASTLGVTSVPHLLVIDPHGTIRYSGHPAGVTEEFLRSL